MYCVFVLFVHPFVCPYLCPCIRDVVSVISLVEIREFSPNFVAAASWDKKELIGFWDEKVTVPA